jgi:hypothetical protein
VSRGLGWIIGGGIAYGIGIVTGYEVSSQAGLPILILGVTELIHGLLSKRERAQIIVVRVND